MADPREEVRPDYEAAEFEQERAAFGEDLAAAVQILNALWEVRHAKRVAEWERRQNQDNVPPPPNNEQRRDQDNEQNQGRQEGPNQQGPGAEGALEQRILLDIPAISVDEPPPSRPEWQVDPYAVEQLRGKRLTALWYFTDEGLEWAQRPNSGKDDNLIVAQDERGLTLRTRLRPSPKEVPDVQLSWLQVEVGATRMVSVMHQVGYPDQVVAAVASMYTTLIANPIRKKVSGDEAIVVYQYRVRKMWHEAVAGGRVPFNIARINQDLLEAIREELEEFRLQKEGEVYVFSFPQ